MGIRNRCHIDSNTNWEELYERSYLHRAIHNSKSMKTFHYIAFQRDSYNTSVTYSRNLLVLDKESIVIIADSIGLKLDTSHTKEQLADELSTYVRTHAGDVLAHADDEQILLLKELIDAGPNTIVWKKHLHKYNFLKMMVWVVVKYDKQGKRDGFVLVDELREAFAPVVEERLATAKQHVAEKKAANKQKRVTLKDIKQMMAGMSLDLAEKVHLLFMANYIDYSGYWFRDEWQVDGYVNAYNDLFIYKTGEVLLYANHYVFGFLEEWRKYSPSLYRRAKDDLKWWITDEWYKFESPLQKEIEEAWEMALATNEEQKVVLALSPLALRTYELVKGKAYEEAAGCCYTIFRCLAKTSKEHGDWFHGFLNDNKYSKLTMFLEAVTELYKHLRQLPDVPKTLISEMDIQLEVFNKETDFFGDMLCDSRWSDMLCDGKDQYQNYKVLEDCPMWGRMIDRIEK